MALDAAASTDSCTELEIRWMMSACAGTAMRNITSALRSFSFGRIDLVGNLFLILILLVLLFL